MPDGKRGREAELRAERIRWKGSARTASRASRNIDEHLRRIRQQADSLDHRLRRHEENSRVWHVRWDDHPGIESRPGA